MSARDRDTASPSHQRPPFADPLPGGLDPTAPGAPHEPGGEATRQSGVNRQPSRREPDTSARIPRPTEPDAA